MWERAFDITPTTKMKHLHGEERVATSEAAVLKKIFTCPLSFDQVDSSVTVIRNRALYSSTNFVASLEVARKKVELYGVTLTDV
jgi:hypothetical protein